MWAILSIGFIKVCVGTTGLGIQSKVNRKANLVCLPAVPWASLPWPAAVSSSVSASAKVRLSALVICKAWPRRHCQPVCVTRGWCHQMAGLAIYLQLDIFSPFQTQPKSVVLSTSKIVWFYFKNWVLCSLKLTLPLPIHHLSFSRCLNCKANLEG